MRRVTPMTVSLAVVLLMALASASPALAESPWWHLTSGSRPTNLQPGQARNEVQEVKVSATGGQLVLANLTPEQVEEGELFDEEGEPLFTILPFNAEASVAQEGLEEVYGAGNVEVSGGPGDAGGSKPYVVRFKGELADRSVGIINTELSSLKGTASVTEVTAGRSDGALLVTAENVGDASIDGSKVPAQITDKLPAGLRAVGIAAVKPFGFGTGARPPVPCSLKTLTCTLAGTLLPYGEIEVRIAVVVEAGAASGELNEVSATGGEAPSTSIRRAIIVSGEPTPFGIEDYELSHEEEGGALDTQAGSHPFQQTTTFALNQTADAKALGPPTAVPVALPKDVSFKWPPGLIGNPTVLPRCTIGQFLTIHGNENGCPPQTAVGVVLVTVNEPHALGAITVTVPLFNLEPRAGEPARFGFIAIEAGAPAYIDTAVRTGGDYGITVTSSNITQTAAFLSVSATVWGVPGDPRHDNVRGWGCLLGARGIEPHAPCNALEEQHPPPFLSLPTSCTGPLQSSVEADPWIEPGDFREIESEPIPALDGCNQLPFSASIKVAPDGQAASTPTGLTVDVHVPQDESQNPNGLAGSELKDIAVTLPQGFRLNPAAADGLQACSETQIGYLPGESTPPADLHFTPTLPSPFCPDASKVATLKLKVPVLEHPLEGAVYLAAQDANPFGSLIAMYLVAEDPVSGVLVKIPGRVSLDQATGQITATFENTPQAPFEDAEVHFFGGDRAPLATPSRCGTYTSEATFTPWSGTPPIKSQSSFDIKTGPNGSPCPNGLPFAPSLAAGMTNIQAGAFSPLTTTISREDGNQDIRSVQLHMPPGLSGLLSQVQLCGEAQANAGTCGPDSEIGHTVVSVGLGGDPFSVTGGQVFITGPYRGAPFGLSIVNPAKAGPFDLGKVVVRAKIEVDPSTAQLTVTTDSTGPYAIPSILDGIPLQIKHVNVMIDRPGFTFNPTNCSPLGLTGTIGSVEGASAALSTPFQVTNCATLKFAPKFTVSTSGKTSKANGANLSVKLAYPNGPFGSQANIAKVKVELPKQLPSRLTTLQKACVAAVFEANPANCPGPSVVGHAKVLTPLLPVPVTGPAYLVSHGGEAFPSLTMVLQGYGVTIDLVGTTLIKKGITSTTFKSTPDVPFSTFELTLPQGKFSVLAANANLCKSKLTMPTEFIAQNGAEIHQATKIAVTGCAKAPSKAQLLAKALKACHKKKSHGKRAACERQARKRYGAKQGAKKKKK